MTNLNTYEGRKCVYIMILLSFQSVSIQNVCHGQFRWGKIFKPESKKVRSMFDGDKVLTKVQKNPVERLYLLTSYVVLHCFFCVRFLHYTSQCL